MALYENLIDIVTGKLHPSDNDPIYEESVKKKLAPIDSFLSHPASIKLIKEAEDPGSEKTMTHAVITAMVCERDMLNAWLLWYRSELRHLSSTTYVSIGFIGAYKKYLDAEAALKTARVAASQPSA